MLKGVSTRVVLLLLGIMIVSLLVSFKMNEGFGDMKEGFETVSEVKSTQEPVAENNTESKPAPAAEPEPELKNTEPELDVTKDIQVKPQTTADPVPANKQVNAMSQRLGLTSEDKSHMQSIITKVFANAGTFAAEKLGHMMEGFESRSSVPSSLYV